MSITLFSIIIPTYNRADRISTTLQSILDQRYPHFEIIVVDDGSTDNTKGVVSTIDDSRINYYYKQNEERATARNFGINKAKGEYITFLDSDDRLYPHCFDEALKVIEENDTPEWLHLGYEIKNDVGRVIRKENKRKGNINKTLITGNHLSCIGVFIRKDIIMQHRFNESPDIIGSEDYLLWLEIACRYILAYSNTVSAFMVQHDERSVTNFDEYLLINRIQKTIEYVLNDNQISVWLHNQKGKFVAHRYLYLALHLALIRRKKKSSYFLVRAIREAPLICFNKKTMLICLKLII